MAITYVNLRAKISRTLRDPNNKAFDPNAVNDIIYAALAEISRLAPHQFTEDITLVDNQLSYAVQTLTYSGDTPPEIRVADVEIWDASQTPQQLILSVVDAAGEYGSADNGWRVWGGVLTLPTLAVRVAAGYSSTYVLRVRGYGPYVLPVNDTDVVAVSAAGEEGIVRYAWVEGLRRLIANRDLYSQWQAHAGNTDTTLAGLLNNLNVATQDWLHYSRSIARLRSAV